MAPFDDAFAYRTAEGEMLLCAEDVPLARIADALGTPLYCYAAAAIRGRYRAFAEALAASGAAICYALKANDNPAIVRLFTGLGAGADVVSGGELRRALAAGIAPSRIIFSGVGKSEEEIGAALRAGIGQFNVESEPELRAIAHLAAGLGMSAPVALRVNPDIAAGSHEKVSTGRKHDKFGIAFDDAVPLYRAAQSLAALRTVGLAVHIGSQITALAPFEAAFARVVGLARALRAEGLPLERLDLGGGLGIAYGEERPPALADYGALIARLTAGLGLALAVEPGRALVGPAGVLLARVLYVKESERRRIVILDAAMNDLIRPALYGARHPVRLVRAPTKGAPLSPCDLVGPVCETGDTFARDLLLPPVAAGDLLVFGQAGAYGAVMASTYNARPLVPEVLVEGGRFAVIRARPAPSESDALYRLPPWFEG